MIILISLEIILRFFSHKYIEFSNYIVMEKNMTLKPIKKDIIKLIQDLPDDVTLEDIQYHLSFTEQDMEVPKKFQIS